MGRKAVGVYVDPEVDLRLHVLSLRLKTLGAPATKSELYELGARLLLVMLEHPDVAEDCLVKVFKHDRELAEQLDTIIAAVKPAEAEVGG